MVHTVGAAVFNDILYATNIALLSCAILTGCFPQFPIILDGNIPPPLELEGRVDGELLAVALAEYLGPLGLARVLLLLEVLVALRSAEFEYLEEDMELHIRVSREMGIIRFFIFLNTLQSFLTNWTPLPG